MFDNESNEVRFTMRMESGLYEQLKESAQKNRRSLAKELEHIVYNHFNNEKYEPTPEQLAMFYSFIEERMKDRENLFSQLYKKDKVKGLE